MAQLDLLCTEGLIKSGVVDLVWNNGWHPASSETLKAAQHGISCGPPVPLPPKAVIALFSVHFSDALARAEGENPGGRYVFIVRDGDQTLREGGGVGCNVTRWPPLIHHIFGINATNAGPRVTPMPLAFHAYCSFADEMSAAMEIPRVKGEQRVLVSFSIDAGSITGKPGHERLRAIERFRGQPWAMVSQRLLDRGSAGVVSPLPWKEYLACLRRHDYLVVPVGYGVDRIAQWEAMVLGTIPICCKHPELLHFMDMPIAFVDRWEDVTPEWCDQNLGVINRPMERLKTSYWVERIREKAAEL